MKCELCHKKDAQTVMVRGEDQEDELYVCEACAKAERIRAQKKSQRTRKISGLPPGISMSVTEISGAMTEDGDPPPIIAALANAFQDMASAFGKSVEEAKPAKDPSPMRELSSERIEREFRVKGAFHLEGLHLIGELEPTKRALRALGMQLAGFEADGVKDAGHVYRLEYSGTLEQAKKVAQDLLREEKNARARLLSEFPRVFGDSLCRALAVLKNCRLLSQGELFDLLSPLRLAAVEGMIEGIGFSEIDSLLDKLSLDSREDGLDPADQDRIDGERADAMNRRFEEVILNDVV